MAPQVMTLLGFCKTVVALIRNLTEAYALSQAIQALQAATQLWLQKPGKAAQESITGLSHFPAVIQALVQVMLSSVIFAFVTLIFLFTSPFNTLLCVYQV